MIRKLSMDDLGRKSVQEYKASEKLPVTLLLDNVRSMHNVGSIFRTSDAFLIEKILLCGYTPRPPHRDINKTTLGATETVDWEFVENAREAVLMLKSKGYLIVGVEQAEGSVLLAGFSVGADCRICLILGNEVEGISDGLMPLCDQVIEIPQFGTKHSLNVSVAAGIVLYRISEIFNAMAGQTSGSLSQFGS